jgi:sugar/nucleoside kinase (ribokinase family)
MIILTLPDGTWTGITRIPEEAQLQPGDFPLESIISGKYLHIHGFSLRTSGGRAGADWAVEAAKKEGVVISLDACTPVALETPESILKLVPSCHLFFANVVEVWALTGKSDLSSAALKLLSLGPEAVIIKAGKEGCYLLEKGQNSPGHIPAIFTQIVDTIGAGDAVVAGVIAGQINMLDLEDSVRLGTAAAALVCQGIGAQSRVFNRLDVYQLAGLRPDPKLI